VVLDEPASGLDPGMRERAFRAAADQADGDTAVVVSSHALDLVDDHADRVVVLRRGEVAAEGPLDRLLDEHGVANASELYRVVIGELGAPAGDEGEGPDDEDESDGESDDGDDEGESDGDDEGESDGDDEGESDGDDEGESDGDDEGESDGDDEGESDGDDEGESDGDEPEPTVHVTGCRTDERPLTGVATVFRRELARRWSELRATACWRSDCSSPSSAASRGGRRGRHRVRAGGRRPAPPDRGTRPARRGGVGVPRAALRRRASGELAVIRTYPVRVSEYVAGVLLARTVALVAVVGVPYAVVGAGSGLTVAPDTGIFATHAGIDSPVLYLRFLAFVLLLGAAYVSLAAAVSALAASRRSAIALGVLALVAGVLGGDLLLLRSLGGGASPATISGSLALAPNGGRFAGSSSNT